MENLESRKHLLIKCETTQILFNKIKHKFKEKYDHLSEEKSILFIGLDENDSKFISFSIYLSGFLEIKLELIKLQIFSLTFGGFLEIFV
jgi:hypothetical protein